MYRKLKSYLRGLLDDAAHRASYSTTGGEAAHSLLTALYFGLLAVSDATTGY